MKRTRDLELRLPQKEEESKDEACILAVRVNKLLDTIEETDKKPVDDARIDPLTLVANRRSYEEHLAPDRAIKEGTLGVSTTTHNSLLENRKSTILLVEDEGIVREMAVAMLMSLGFKVLPAKDGVEALEIFENHIEDIHLVVSDLSMPRMDGWETLAAIRKIRQSAPVILVSGYNEATVLAGDHPEFPLVFLQKPYKKTELQDAIAKAMGS